MSHCIVIFALHRIAIFVFIAQLGGRSVTLRCNICLYCTIWWLAVKHCPALFVLTFILLLIHDMFACLLAHLLPSLLSYSFTQSLTYLLNHSPLTLTGHHMSECAPSTKLHCTGHVLQRAGHPNSIYYFGSHWTGVADGRTSLLCHTPLFWTGDIDDRTSLLCHTHCFGQVL